MRDTQSPFLLRKAASLICAGSRFEPWLRGIANNDLRKQPLFSLPPFRPTGVSAPCAKKQIPSSYATPMNQSKVYPGFWHSVLLCVIFLSVQMVAMMPLGVLDAVFKLKLSTHPALLGVANLMACGAVVYLGWLIGRPALAEVFRCRRISVLAVVGVMIATCGAIIVLSEADNLVRLLLPPPKWLADLMRELTSSSGNLWAAFFLLVIVAPVTEEIMFRGLILRGFLTRFGLFKAFLFSSILFGAIHLNPWQFVSASALGMMFAWWYVRTRSLVPCLIGHALTNGIAFGHQSLPFKIKGFNAGDSFAFTGFQPLWFDLLGLVLLAVGLWLFRAATPPILPRAENPVAPTPVSSEPNSGLPPIISPVSAATPVAIPNLASDLDARNEQVRES